MTSMETIPDDKDIEACCSHSDPVVRRLALEVKRLRMGIRNHQAQTGHSLCWLNDVELWKLLDKNAAYPHETLPVRDEFLANCKKFYVSRLEGTAWQDPPVGKTVVDKR